MFTPRRQPPVQSAIRDTVLPEFHGGAYIGNDHSLPNQNKDRWAQILAYDGTQYYSWQEVFSYDLLDSGGQPSGVSGFVVADGGLSGQLTGGGPTGTGPLHPLFEANGNFIPVGAYVRFRFSHVDPLWDDTFVAVFGGSPQFVQMIRDQVPENHPEYLPGVNCVTLVESLSGFVPTTPPVYFEATCPDSRPLLGNGDRFWIIYHAVDGRWLPTWVPETGTVRVTGEAAVFPGYLPGWLTSPSRLLNRDVDAIQIWVRDANNPSNPQLGPQYYTGAIRWDYEFGRAIYNLTCCSTPVTPGSGASGSVGSQGSVGTGLCIPDRCGGKPAGSYPFQYALAVDAGNDVASPCSIFTSPHGRPWVLNYVGGCTWTVGPTVTLGGRTGPLWELVVDATGNYHLFAAGSELPLVGVLLSNGQIQWQVDGWTYPGGSCELLAFPTAAPLAQCPGGSLGSGGASGSFSGSAGSHGPVLVPGCIPDACPPFAAGGNPNQWLLNATGLGLANDCAALNGNFVLYYRGGCLWQSNEVVDQTAFGGSVYAAWTVFLNSSGQWRLLAVGQDVGQVGIQGLPGGTILFPASTWALCANTAPVILTPATVCPTFPTQPPPGCQFCTASPTPTGYLLSVTGFGGACAIFNNLAGWNLLPNGGVSGVGGNCAYAITVAVGNALVVIDITVLTGDVQLGFSYYVQGGAILASALYHTGSPMPGGNCCLPLVFTLTQAPCNCGSTSPGNPCAECVGITPASWNWTFNTATQDWSFLNGAWSAPQEVTGPGANCIWGAGAGIGASPPSAAVEFQLLSGGILAARFENLATGDFASYRTPSSIRGACCLAQTLELVSFSPGLNGLLPNPFVATPSCVTGSNCPPTLTALPNCGGSSGSVGSVGSGSGGSTLGCCKGFTLPTNTKILFSGGTGSAVSLNGLVMHLTGGQGGNLWGTGTGQDVTVCTFVDGAATINCPGGTQFLVSPNFMDDLVPNYNVPDSVSCSPFILTLMNRKVAVVGTCTSGTINMTVVSDP